MTTPNKQEAITAFISMVLLGNTEMYQMQDMAAEVMALPDPPPIDQFKALLAAGLTQAVILSALHDADPEVAKHDGIIQAARDNYTDDDCEIDAKPLLSVSDEGVWVSAWVWVAIDKDDEEEPDEADVAPVERSEA